MEAGLAWRLQLEILKNPLRDDRKGPDEKNQPNKYVFST